MNNGKILIVEDDVAIRNLIATALETENYEYRMAKDGKQALIEATTKHPEMILLDLGLPDMDGVDVIKKIRSCQYKIVCLLAKNMGRVLTHTFIAKEI